MARYASFCLIMGPFKGKCLFLPDYGPFGRCGVHWDACNNRVRIKVSIGVRVRVSFTTGAVRSAILATAGLLVTKFSKVMHLGPLLRFLEVKNPRWPLAAILKNGKDAISTELPDRFWWNLALSCTWDLYNLWAIKIIYLMDFVEIFVVTHIGPPDPVNH